MSTHLCAGFCLKSTRVVGGCESGKMVSMLHVKIARSGNAPLGAACPNKPCCFPARLPRGGDATG